jgi:hypothetical protein
MLTLPEAWSEVTGDYLHWLIVFVGFSAVAMAVWVTDAALRRRKRAPASETATPEPAPR